MRRNTESTIVVRAPSNDAANELSRKLMVREREIRQQDPDFKFMHTRLLPNARAELEIHEEPDHVLNEVLFHHRCNRWAWNYLDPRLMVGDHINGFAEITQTGSLARNTARKHYNNQRAWMASQVIPSARVVITTCVHSGLQWLGQHFEAEWIVVDEMASAHTYEFVITPMTLLSVVLAGDHK